MADILPPAPVDAPFGSYNWADWYKKVRDAINNAGSVSWASVTGKPTTLVGYGITDAVSVSRQISTTAPLTGGGTLASDLSLAISSFTGSVPGAVPTSLGGTTNFLRADGGWAAPGGGGGGTTWTEVEIDFGSTPVYETSFVVVDALVLGTTNKVVVLPCGKAATDRTADDWLWDGGMFAANPAVGSFTCYATFFPGPIVGKRKIQYSVG